MRSDSRVLWGFQARECDDDCAELFFSKFDQSGDKIFAYIWKVNKKSDSRLKNGLVFKNEIFSIRVKAATSFACTRPCT